LASQNLRQKTQAASLCGLAHGRHYQPGAEITLTSTAKKKMPKELSFFLGNQLLTPTPVDALSVEVTVPSDIPTGTYTLRVASGKRVTKTLFSQSITIATPPVVNGKIAFQSDRDGNYEIYTMNADGSGQINLSNNAAYDYSPVFSPDGSKSLSSQNATVTMTRRFTS
jgi:hypothetical protein